jgi:phosphatidylglycerol lysyltransferase
VPVAPRDSAISLKLARDIVIEYGWNSTCYQILNPGMDYWFSAAPRAVVGYTRRHSVLLVAGGPVCESETLASVCDQFEAFARQQRCSVCYVCAEERLQSLFARSSHHATIALGAQPAWNPQTWPDVVRNRASLRAQLHRASNKGVVVEDVSLQDAPRDPELRRVLQQWLEGRRLPPLHFMVEPNVLDGVLTDRIILMARLRGAPVAFLVASPAAARQGYLVELLARSPAAPNGSSELLIDAAMRRFADEGSEYATLGLVALAHAADQQIRSNPAWLRMMMYFARAHANRFYNFRGLERFRVKMAPDRWEPVYAISNEPGFPVRTLYAMGAAFSGIPPWAAIAIGVAKAVRDEFRTAFRPRLKTSTSAPTASPASPPPSGSSRTPSNSM